MGRGGEEERRCEEEGDRRWQRAFAAASPDELRFASAAAALSFSAAAAFS